MGYDIVKKSNLAELCCDEHFTTDDAKTVLSELRESDWFSSMRSFLIIDQHSAFDPSKEELAQIAELFLSLLAGQDLRIAVVVSKLVHYGIGRMVEALAGTQGDRFRVFMEEEEARAWLAGDQS